MKKEITNHKKEILVSFLNNQIRDLRDFVFAIESEDSWENEAITSFFSSKTKLEKSLLNNLLN